MESNALLTLDQWSELSMSITYSKGRHGREAFSIHLSCHPSSPAEGIL